MPLARAQARYWIVAGIVAAVVAVSVAILTHPDSLAPSPTEGIVRVGLGASPATLGGPPCAEFPVVVTLAVGNATVVRGAALQVLSRQAVLASGNAACTGTPDGWQPVRLPSAAASVALPALTRSGAYRLDVLPPPGGAAGAIRYTWRITISYSGVGGAISDSVSSPHFTLVAPP